MSSSATKGSVGYLQVEGLLKEHLSAGRLERAQPGAVSSFHPCCLQGGVSEANYHQNYNQVSSERGTWVKWKVGK